MGVVGVGGEGGSRKSRRGLRFSETSATGPKSNPIKFQPEQTSLEPTNNFEENVGVELKWIPWNSIEYMDNGRVSLKATPTKDGLVGVSLEFKRPVLIGGYRSL